MRDPIGDTVRNLFDLQRLANGLSVESRDIIARLFEDIIGEIAKNDPTAVGLRFQSGRIDKIEAAVRGLSREKYAEWFRQVRSDLARIGAQQATWAQGTLIRSIGSVGIDVVASKRVGVNQMKAILDSKPFQGEILKDWAGGLDAGVVRGVRQQIQLGMARNETLDQIVRRVRGRSAGRRGQFTGGVWGTNTKNAEAVIRTGVNHIANQGHMLTYQNNADILSGVESVAVIDSRTTAICMALDGRVWALDDPNIDVPPREFNCRSVLVPIVDWKGLGIDPPDEGTRAARDPRTGTVTQIKASTTYQDWLKKLGETPEGIIEQNKILGPGRAKLFRDGKIDLRDLVRKDHSIVKLDDLQKKAS